jgi:hypothetical protein
LRWVTNTGPRVRPLRSARCGASGQPMSHAIPCAVRSRMLRRGARGMWVRCSLFRRPERRNNSDSLARQVSRRPCCGHSSTRFTPNGPVGEGLRASGRIHELRWITPTHCEHAQPSNLGYCCSKCRCAWSADRRLTIGTDIATRSQKGEGRGSNVSFSLIEAVRATDAGRMHGGYGDEMLVTPRQAGSR